MSLSSLQVVITLSLTMSKAKNSTVRLDSSNSTEKMLKRLIFSGAWLHNSTAQLDLKLYRGHEAADSPTRTLIVVKPTLF